MSFHLVILLVMLCHYIFITVMIFFKYTLQIDSFSIRKIQSFQEKYGVTILVQSNEIVREDITVILGNLKVIWELH